MICPNCHCEVENDKKFCPNCGAAVTFQAQTPPPPPPVNGQQYQQPYRQPQINQQGCEPLSTGQFVLMDFLASIPLVGLILYFVWAFSSSENPNRRNWAKARLIWILISIAVSILIIILFSTTLAAIFGSISNYLN